MSDHTICPECGSQYPAAIECSLCKFIRGRDPRPAPCSLGDVVQEFLSIMQIEEVSDNGRTFRPNGISTCRAMDGVKLAKLLREMERLTDNANCLVSGEAD